MKYKINKLKGFTFSEVMIALGVVIIFGLFAFNAYRDYARRYHYNEIVQAANALKEPVSYCFQDLKTVTGCNGGTHHIPANIKAPHGSIASATVKDGIITVSPVTWDGIAESDTYILTPKAVHNELVWTPSGNGIAHGLTS
jgi:Tfp pilus assembly major pilin PilA